MRRVFIAVVIVAAVLVVLGAINHGHLVDVDYLFGTWHSVSLLMLSLIAAALVLVAGVLSGLVAELRVSSDLHKLEAELQRTYARLREAEAAVPQPAPDEAAAESGPQA
jgi:uncharacterized membrane protein YciS (DUF1049 family)